MKIYIGTVHREAVSIEILETAKISDLKKEIASKIPEVKLSEQILKFESKVMMDGDTLKKCGITENALIELLTLKKKSTVVIKTDDNKMHELEVDFSKSIDVVKRQINQLLRIPTESQKLFMAELKNKDILSEKQIGPGATLHLCVVNLNLKLNLVLTKSTGPPEQIDVPKTYKISQLKDFIATKWKIPVQNQTVSCMGQILDNNKKTLADYNIPNLSTINVKPNTIEIFIEASLLGKNCFPLLVLPTETVEMVKKKIQGSLKVNAEFQKLIWNGTLLDDQDVLITKGIVLGSTLNLILTIQALKLNIRIGEAGKTVLIDTSGSETIAQLKQKIQNKTKIPCAEQRLYCVNIELEDSKTCTEYSFSESSNILLKRIGGFDILIQALTGKTFKVPVHNSETVEDIKRKVETFETIPMDQQRLIFRGRELLNPLTVNEYEMKDGDVVHLVLRIGG